MFNLIVIMRKQSENPGSGAFRKTMGLGSPEKFNVVRNNQAKRGRDYSRVNKPEETEKACTVG